MVSSESDVNAALALLKPLFKKILFVNTEDLSFSTVIVEDKEYEELTKRAQTITEYFSLFTQSTYIHPDYKETFTNFVKELPALDYIGHCVYKRLDLESNVYHWNLLESLPTEEPNKRILYIKDIDYIYTPAYDSVIEVIGTTDAITGLLNNLAYQRDCKKYIAGPVGAIYIDANGLKWINDTKGHAEGNRLIQRIASDLKSRYGNLAGYRCYHLHGDEFLVIYLGDDLSNFVLNANEYHRCMNVDMYAALGYSVSTSLSDAVRKAEMDMYRDKATYYALHPERAR